MEISWLHEEVQVLGCQLHDFGGLAIPLPRLEHPFGHFIFLPEFPGILADDG